VYQVHQSTPKWYTQWYTFLHIPTYELVVVVVQLFAKKNTTGNLAHEEKKNVCVFFNNNNTPPSLTKATRTQAIEHQITSTVA